jgi:membrane fusion protein, multidrug efflux system
VQLLPRRGSATLTGEVQARLDADLSFRVGGRIVERVVDIGDHVEAGDVLARLDATEQRADIDAATAAVAAAEAQLRVAQSTFGRQRALLADGFTTRPTYDQAQEALRTAEASLEAARAKPGLAKDALACAELSAESRQASGGHDARQRRRGNGQVEARTADDGALERADVDGPDAGGLGRRPG